MLDECAYGSAFADLGGISLLGHCFAFALDFALPLEQVKSSAGGGTAPPLDDASDALTGGAWPLPLRLDSRILSKISHPTVSSVTLLNRGEFSSDSMISQLVSDAAELSRAAGAGCCHFSTKS